MSCRTGSFSRATSFSITRSAAWAEELAEHRAVVDVAPVIADVRIGGADIGIAAHAVILVIARARAPGPAAHLAAGGVHAILFAAQVEVVGQTRATSCAAKAGDAGHPSCDSLRAGWSAQHAASPSASTTPSAVITTP